MKTLLAILTSTLLANCAAPYREPTPNWGGISREVGRTLQSR